MGQQGKTTAIKSPMTKTQIISALSEATELDKKKVNLVLEELEGLIERHLRPRGAGQFTLPGLLKIVKSTKPATKERKGINPFTGEEAIFKAKPARKIIKVKALKKLKDMVS